MPYSTNPKVQAYAIRAHRMRRARVATLFRDVVRWISIASR
jgi:hypothetical protein